ncbi:MAG TPA: choice-of-anchor J domain-containing protein [Bacteroidia bacterium]|nr:choice-of-anchor J domain-containing protein [Bacteroidia bacterium]HQW49884.1 choice-of-anchor J domain-containing protein [Bacteroidia bacterium]HQX69475.1 choice-of-anchor J domain-containing protein [Bacteroidia bacterium]HQZ78253.1 choice-of-anchor J domain-containing protein [Bacteroidia bacterium]HRA59722.1 choice-of-anchor J domain-containing protein [Bacteroidia bacterium]
MKKIFTILTAACLVVGIANAQSQRYVVVEEFTGETCGPCAANNPGFNTKLNANAFTIPIKYQNNIPSNGPNYYSYNTIDVANRTSFYANNYSPHAFLDGNVWDGNAGSFPVATLNSRVATTSPFTVDVTHSFSPTHDIIYTHTVIRATQAVTGLTSLKARIAITEKDLYGYTSPNGESHYSDVMRKMLPNGTGTILPATWAVGDSVVLDEQWTINVPTNIPTVFMPYWPMLRAVAFVQNDATKEIMQGGRSSAAAVVPLAAITNLASIFTCTSSIDPSVTLKNYGGGGDLTSADIEYGIVGQTMQTYNWSGNLGSNTSVVLTLPNLTLPGAGLQNFSAKLISVNGNAAFHNINLDYKTSVAQTTAPVTSLSQDFLATTFPPVNWILNNPDNATTWVRSAAGSLAGGSAKMNFYTYAAAGQSDYLYPYTPIDMTNAVNPQLTFSVAYCQYSTENDRLQVLASTDCGVTWTSLFNEAGAALSTSPAQTTAFTPTSASQWESKTVSLANYVGQPSLLLSFKATNAYGNNLYVDDINLTGVTAVHQIEGVTTLEVFPNPASDVLNIKATMEKSLPMTISLTDISGRKLFQKNLGTVSVVNETVKTSDFAAGIYTLEVRSGDSVSYQKITIK